MELESVEYKPSVMCSQCGWIIPLEADAETGIQIGARVVITCEICGKTDVYQPDRVWRFYSDRLS